MNARERIMAVLHHEEPDVIPVTTLAEEVIRYGLGFSEPWRNLLDLGLGVNCEMWAPVHKVVCPHVKMEATHDYGNVTSWSPTELFLFQEIPHAVRITFTTPVGSVSSTTKCDTLPCLFWLTEGANIIKDLSDYDVVKFMIEDAEYSPNYEDILMIEMGVGDLGVVPAIVPKPPIQSMIVLMGYRRFSIDYYTHRKEFDELYRLIYKKELDVYKIAAESPAEIIWAPANVNAVVTTPKIFEKYSIPFYNEAANILHKHGKIYMAHMDGKLASLRDLIAKTNIDVIEGFMPPPIGDLPLKEAREAWKEKIIWANFPETLSLYGQDAVEKRTIEILKSVAPGDNFLLGTTEDWPSPLDALDSLTTILKTVMRHGVYPIPKD